MDEWCCVFATRASFFFQEKKKEKMLGNHSKNEGEPGCIPEMNP